MRRWTLLVCAAGALLVGGGVASAGTLATVNVEVLGSPPNLDYYVYYTAGAAPPRTEPAGFVGAPDITAHRMVFSDASFGRVLRISDPGVRVVSHSPLCTSGTGGTVCTIAAGGYRFAQVYVIGSAAADVFDASNLNSISFYAEGLTGADRFIGSPNGDVIFPGAGADDVRGGGGRDDVTLNGFLDGEPGPVTVTLDDLANDGMATSHKNIHSDVESVHAWGEIGGVTLIGNGDNNLLVANTTKSTRLVGGGGDDTLLVYTSDSLHNVLRRSGTARSVILAGGPGNDFLIVDGAAKTGRLDGGPGDDYLSTASTPAYKQDLVCGDGIDQALGDLLDAIAADCETVHRVG